MDRNIRLFILVGLGMGMMGSLSGGILFAQTAQKSQGTTFVGRGGKVTITDKNGSKVIEGSKVRPVNRVTTVPPAPASTPSDGASAAANENQPQDTKAADTASPETPLSDSKPVEPATSPDTAKDGQPSPKPANKDTPSGTEEKKESLEPKTEVAKPAPETNTVESPAVSKETPTGINAGERSSSTSKVSPVSADTDKKGADTSRPGDPKKKTAETPAEKTRKDEDTKKLQNVLQTGGWFYDKNGKAISNEEMAERIKKGNIKDIKAIDIYEEQYKTESEKDKKTP